MPNGGTDNCGTCWFHDAARCTLRDEPIEHSYYTYCANHPHHNPGKVSQPVGPVYTVDSRDRRVVLRASPDSEAIRKSLLWLLDRIPEIASPEYPSPTMFDDQVIEQLGKWREIKAVAGLRRIVGFAPVRERVPDESFWGRLLAETGNLMDTDVRCLLVQRSQEERAVDRQRTMGRAAEALARILGEGAIPDIEPLVLAADERLTGLRALAVWALRWCGSSARPILERAAADPVEHVAGAAQRVLEDPASSPREREQPPPIDCSPPPGTAVQRAALTVQDSRLGESVFHVHVPLGVGLPDLQARLERLKAIVHSRYSASAFEIECVLYAETCPRCGGTADS
ncbi:MAG: HEAT repeat domain-containing protein [Armatimonadetes bacterium]|nr:HEAT repeat domain-containing protein [Armatimonadota bacterium]